MLLTSLALVIGLQSVPQTVVAVKNDDPETWVVEYPRLIQPFVQEYRQCLNVSDRRVTGEANFEVQHRADVPRCEEVKATVIARSNAAMAGAKSAIGPEEVDQLFANIGLIHVARGRDLDDQFKQRIAAAAAAQAQYENERPRGLVLELHDASVVKSRAELQGAAAPAQQPNPTGTQ
jgi:hypothetical protein